MTTTRVRSRILQHFSKELIEALYKITSNRVVSDNNIKVEAVLNLLNDSGLDYVELGPGTNRLAILIDNYVFKIALDMQGMQDNINELTMTQELQPYAAKTYETNELLSVHEYVTVISREEFEERKFEMREILGILAESYLFGDVGTVAKNFTNWGYRDNGELVILDFAYIYRVRGDELLCSVDQSILEYDENFHTLLCPTCHRKYTFMDLRRRITVESEKHENMIAKQLAYKVTKPVQEFVERYTEEEVESSTSLYKSKVYQQQNTSTITQPKEEITMRDENEYKNNNTSQEDSDEAYLRMLERLSGQKNEVSVQTEATPQERAILTESAQVNASANLIEINRETPNERTHIRVIHQSTDSASVPPVVEAALETVREVAEEIQEHDRERTEEDVIGDLLLEINVGNEAVITTNLHDEAIRVENVVEDITQPESLEYDRDQSWTPENDEIDHGTLQGPEDGTGITTLPDPSDIEREVTLDNPEHTVDSPTEIVLNQDPEPISETETVTKLSDDITITTTTKVEVEGETTDEARTKLILGNMADMLPPENKKDDQDENSEYSQFEDHPSTEKMRKGGKDNGRSNY